MIDASAMPTVVAGNCWLPPVVGAVADPYREPPCRWCAGNRGIDYRVGSDVGVSAAASGRVEFVGTIVDVRYVVIRLANGWRHTYGQLTATSLGVGDVVFAGSTIGRASDTFYFGLRIGEDYADPAPFIGVLRTQPRLIPLDGTPARPAPTATTAVCGRSKPGDVGSRKPPGSIFRVDSPGSTAVRSDVSLFR